MCGRYVLKATLQELERKYGAVPEGTYSFDALYNVAPSAEMPVVLNLSEGPRIVPLRWGLVPFWADSVNTGYSMINARSESLTKKRSFREPFRSRRCVIPASGFYEWKRSGSSKIPYYITAKSSPLMNFAGLYEQWISEEGVSINSFTIVTTPANRTMEELHDRMPAMLTDEETKIWIDPGNRDTDALQSLLRPWADDDIQFYRVDQQVNNARSSGPQLIEPYRDLFS